MRLILLSGHIVAGIMTGDENGNFNPKSGTTRAQAASVFMRLYK